MLSAILAKLNSLMIKAIAWKKCKKSLPISLQQPQPSRNLDLANFSPTLLWKKYKLNFKDRVAQIILLVDCCLQSYFLRTAKYLALRTTKMATAADTTSWTSTNKHWIAFSQFLRSETKHIITGYMDIGLSGQLINVTLNPYNYHNDYFSDYNAILPSFCHNLFMITFTLNLDFVVWSFSKCDIINDYILPF